MTDDFKTAFHDKLKQNGKMDKAIEVVYELGWNAAIDAVDDISQATVPYNNDFKMVGIKDLEKLKK